MERGEKEVIIFKKPDRLGKMQTFHIYMIDDTLARDFKSLVKRKEENKNTSFIKKVLPKNLFEVVENKYLSNDQFDKYKYEKELQFKMHKYELEPYSLVKHMDCLKVI